MIFLMKKTILLLILASLFVAARAADTKAAPAANKVERPAAAKSHAAPKPRQWIYVLRLIPRLHADIAWTDAGQVILAGRTREAADKTMGLVVFTAADEAAAREFMLGDPCVAAGVMLGTLHPYDLALLRKN